jgi:hypothetical protein
VYKEGLGYLPVCAISSRSSPPAHMCICNGHPSSELCCVCCTWASRAPHWTCLVKEAILSGVFLLSIMLLAITFTIRNVPPILKCQMMKQGVRGGTKKTCFPVAQIFCTTNLLLMLCRGNISFEPICRNKSCTFLEDLIQCIISRPHIKWRWCCSDLTSFLARHVTADLGT